MWAIQLVDGKLGVIYLREYLLDGRILLFDKEEAALRFMRSVRKKIESALNVKLRTIRYCNDPRKDKLYKVSDSNINMLIEFISSFVE